MAITTATATAAIFNQIVFMAFAPYLLTALAKASAGCHLSSFVSAAKENLHDKKAAAGKVAAARPLCLSGRWTPWTSWTAGLHGRRGPIARLTAAHCVHVVHAVRSVHHAHSEPKPRQQLFDTEGGQSLGYGLGAYGGTGDRCLR